MLHETNLLKLKAQVSGLDVHFFTKHIFVSLSQAGGRFKGWTKVVNSGLFQRNDAKVSSSIYLQGPNE